MGPQTHGVNIDKRWGERTKSPFVTLLPSGAEWQGQHVGVGAKAWLGSVCLWAASPWSPGKVSGGRTETSQSSSQAGREA